LALRSIAQLFAYVFWRFGGSLSAYRVLGADFFPKVDAGQIRFGI